MILCLAIASCAKKGAIDVGSLGTQVSPQAGADGESSGNIVNSANITVTSVSLVNDRLYVNGTGLDEVTGRPAEHENSETSRQLPVEIEGQNFS